MTRPEHGADSAEAYVLKRYRVVGTGRFASVPLADRLWGRIERRGPDECWPWIGKSHDTKGYGLIAVGHTNKHAHRIAYELTFGVVATYLDVDHLCRNRLCCNPAHLEAVTRRENVLRGVGITAENARKTECKRGHPFDDANTWTNPKSGARRCRRCNRDVMRARRAVAA